LDNNLIIILVIVIVVMTALAYIFTTRAKNGNGESPINRETATTMQLQAYERLLILVDRIALPNVITRVNQPTSSAREMQMLLTQNIRSEYDYNITQQIYVTAEAWNAVKNLKEQNLLIINQMANVLPPHATGLDLNKLLLEFLMNDKKGSLHEVVSEVLSYEAKKLMS
jgi:heme/copper-type cytochrome/quinol oxidase subunit 2